MSVDAALFKNDMEANLNGRGQADPMAVSDLAITLSRLTAYDQLTAIELILLIREHGETDPRFDLRGGNIWLA